MCRASHELTNRIREAAIDTGKIWFGPTVYQGRVAFRVSISSWRTTDQDIQAAIELLAGIRDRQQ